MAWTKAKTAIVVGVALLLAAGSTTELVIHVISPPPAPRASWKFAGYGSPSAAFMSYMWSSICQTNRATFEASLTSAQRDVYAQMVAMNAKVPQLHSEAETVMEIFKRADKNWENGNYRIVGEQRVDPDQALLHVEAQSATGAQDVVVRMKKIRGEWRFDGFRKRMSQ